jgi:hypothetical protein
MAGSEAAKRVDGEPLLGTAGLLTAYNNKRCFIRRSRSLFLGNMPRTDNRIA